MIPYSKLRSLTARRLLAALQADGFVLRRQTGSHRYYRHPDGRGVTVSFHHSSDTFRMGTLKSMIELQAKWTDDDLLRWNCCVDLNLRAGNITAMIQYRSLDRTYWA